MKKLSFIKDAVNAAKSKLGLFVANKLLNKESTVITLKGTGGLTEEQRSLLASMVDIDAMFKAKKYSALIRLGILHGFKKRGLIKEFIANFPKHAEELGAGAWAVASGMISEEDLEEYVKDPNSKEFRFFIYHPLGLKVLVAHDFSGFIAAHEKEFRKKAECLMPYFASAGVDQKEYKALLDKVLD